MKMKMTTSDCHMLGWNGVGVGVSLCIGFLFLRWDGPLQERAAFRRRIFLCYFWGFQGLMARQACSAKLTR
jgi:hypothetical protein